MTSTSAGTILIKKSLREVKKALKGRDEVRDLTERFLLLFMLSATSL